MRIAATYDNGLIFQHFGKTENFKVYEIENGAVVSEEIIGSNGSGHGALAGFLAENKIDVLICGGIGDGAQNALLEAGIEICAGAEGDADAAVAAYLNGDLVNAGVTCDHHHEEEHTCGEHGCGSCGGCGGARPVIEGPNVGKRLKVHYKGTFNDGTQFDSSYDRGEPLEFVCGAGMMIKGFDVATATMEVGQVIDVHLSPEDAYGAYDPNLILVFEISKLPGSEELSPGQQVHLYDTMGQPVPVKVLDKNDTTITLDANHEMAGKELNFTIELVEIV